ncbi:ESX secretion-associated protein EspG [Goodfellowiella coeruleoviolacea]|uniref:EspG family protein n=1 Tax=Goodfellowiella coeruleoviolacea TaxID=334858 RepID=A0AAE3KEN5_9PSEU|nr:ESX secretion-associated protein EspG [Goodfellowiella coeruleoviolacea]MCP2164030.1 EspG family protein [Goodfellowiella coeruleoviolacea]
MSIDVDYVLSTQEFDILWADLDLGRVPYPLTVPSVGATMEERAEIATDVRQALQRRGLLRETGNPGQPATRSDVDPELLDLLEVLAAPNITVDAVGYTDGPICALASAGRQVGVLASLTPEGLLLAGIRPTALATSIVEVLPPGQAGNKQALSFPLRALHHAVNSEDEESDDPFGEEDSEVAALTKAGVTADDAATILALANDWSRGGQFGVTAGSGSRAQRGGTLLTWFDGGDGRYLVVNDGEWLSLAPANSQRIAARIEEMIASVAGGQ